MQGVIESKKKWETSVRKKDSKRTASKKQKIVIEVASKFLKIVLDTKARIQKCVPREWSTRGETLRIEFTVTSLDISTIKWWDLFANQSTKEENSLEKLLWKYL